MGFGGASYRSISAPVPQAADETHLDSYQPFIPPGDKHGEASSYYDPQGPYGQPAPLQGAQYSTAWDQNR